MQVEMGSVALKLILTTAGCGHLCCLEQKEDAGRPRRILASAPLWKQGCLRIDALVLGTLFPLPSPCAAMAHLNFPSRMYEQA